jgi:uncharacterized protein YjiS (DUF1127 family)
MKANQFTLIGHTIAALSLRAWRLIIAMKHRRRLANLAGLDDRMLADIGLTRRDLHDAHAEPLWRDPTMMLACRAAEKGEVMTRVVVHSFQRSTNVNNPSQCDKTSKNS